MLFDGGFTYLLHSVIVFVEYFACGVFIVCTVWADVGANNVSQLGINKAFWTNKV